MGFEQAARSIASDLDALELSYALIGGFAVSIRTDPRFTQDIDLAVPVADDDATEFAVNRLAAWGYAILAVVEHETQGRLATVRLELPGESWVVDLLFASSGIESEIVDAAGNVLGVMRNQHYLDVLAGAGRTMSLSWVSEAPRVRCPKVRHRVDGDERGPWR